MLGPRESDNTGTSPRAPLFVVQVFNLPERALWQVKNLPHGAAATPQSTVTRESLRRVELRGCDRGDRWGSFLPLHAARRSGPLP